MVVVIAGPTASGKSSLAIAVAQALGGTIINADASQLYADLSIISARPSRAEEAVVPHRLYGILDGDEVASAARWAELAHAEIAAAHDAGRVPILVGGTGLYLRTLIDGIAPVPDIDPDIRAAVRAMTAAEVHDALARADAAAAARLQPADQQRTRRALEVVRSTGVALGVWQQQRTGGLDHPVRALVLRGNRAALYARCDARFVAMLGAGALDEVRALLARQLPDDRPVLKAVGVPPLAAYLGGQLTLDVAVAQAQQDTRNYAKRQTTWFANQHKDWPAIDPDAPDLVGAALELLN
jgi:tRNA dimethylallyltransferase